MSDKSKKIILATVSGILLILIIVLAVSLSGSSRPSSTTLRDVVESKGSAKDENGKLYDSFIPVKEEITISTEVIEDELRNIGTLITQEYYFTQVEEYSDTKKWIWGLVQSTSCFIYSYDGVVSAGIDCSRITVSKDEITKSILITLPNSEIQYVDIDPDSFRIYEEKEGIWNKLTLTDYNESLKAFETSAKEKAVEKGLIKNANDNAVDMVRRFVNSLVDTMGYTVNVVKK